MQCQFTPIVNSTLADMVDDNTKVKSVSINFFSSFPNLRVTLGSLTITDSLGSNLMVLKELKIKIDIVKYLKPKDVLIHGVEFDGLDISILTDKNGASNIPDFKFLSDSTANDTTDTTELKIQDYIKSIDIKKISLSQGRIYSNDKLLGTYSSIKDISMNLAGAFMSRQSSFDLELKCDGIDYSLNNNHLIKNLKIGVNT